MLTYAASLVHPQDLTPSLLSFKPNPLCTNFCVHYSPLVLKPRERRISSVNLLRQGKAGGSRYPVVVAAVAAEAEVAEAVEGKEGEEGFDGPAPVARTVVVTKPKKGKAALPLKRDRVCAIKIKIKNKKLKL
jgi:large subunit ribosomal protein L1